MTEPIAQLVRYLFTDIAAFTKDRPVEAQADLVDYLNAAVRESLDECNIQENQRILLPTGDGICIAITDASLPYDIHLKLAIVLMARVKQHNDTNQDPLRQFQLRAGLNQNVDNLLRDINGQPNVAGAGINMAQRIMSQGDPGQVMVGQAVHEVLHVREVYFRSFTRYSATAKHGVTFTVFQLIDGSEGVNTSTPSIFAPKPSRPPQLSELAAYYVALALKYKEFLLSLRTINGFSYPATVWLYFSARDLLEESRTPEHEVFKPRVIKPEAPPEEQFRVYKGQDFWVTCQLAEFIDSWVLGDCHDCFDGMNKLFVSATGRKRLESERPEIQKKVIECL